MYISKKKIKGNEYTYLVHSIRMPDSKIKKIAKMLRPEEGTNLEKLRKKYKGFFENKIQEAIKERMGKLSVKEHIGKKLKARKEKENAKKKLKVKKEKQKVSKEKREKAKIRKKKEERGKKKAVEKEKKETVKKVGRKKVRKGGKRKKKRAEAEKKKEAGKEQTGRKKDKKTKGKIKDWRNMRMRDVLKQKEEITKMNEERYAEENGEEIEGEEEGHKGHRIDKKKEWNQQERQTEGKPGFASDSEEEEGECIFDNIMFLYLIGRNWSWAKPMEGSLFLEEK